MTLQSDQEDFLRRHKHSWNLSCAIQCIGLDDTDFGSRPFRKKEVRDD